jgi:SagB-type dehydrogenase family enzyme
MSASSFRDTELNRTCYPAWRDGIVRAEVTGAAQPGPPRRYPGYPAHPLPRPRPRWWPPLDRVLARRRCVPALGSLVPSARVLGRLLWTAHGVNGDEGRGPTPSAGGLQATELYLAILSPAWLPPGLYHYDRAGHFLVRLTETARADLEPMVPSLQLVQRGALLWIVVGDGARVTAKYGERGLRFLLLEAGHLMQNLCLASVSVGLTTVPLGGYFEAEIARLLHLSTGDEVLYLGVCGAISG